MLVHRCAAPPTATTTISMLPFYMFYSMFGFQRIGDLAWAAGDMRTRGFLIGGTAGRTTLNGEGLQHEDGHSHILACTIPNCLHLRPDLRLRAGGDHPRRPPPDGRRAAERVLLPHRDERELPAAGYAQGRGRRHPQRHVPARRAASKKAARVQLLGSGTILREVRRRADLLAKTSTWRRCVERPSFNELRARRPAVRTLEPPASRPRAAQPYVDAMPAGRDRSGGRLHRLHEVCSPTRSAFVPRPEYKVLGTDGFGRSDSRKKLRHFFEVDRNFIVIAALKALRRERHHQGLEFVADPIHSTASIQTNPDRDGVAARATFAAPQGRDQRPVGGVFVPISANFEVDMVEVLVSRDKVSPRRVVDHRRVRQGDDQDPSPASAS